MEHRRKEEEGTPAKVRNGYAGSFICRGSRLEDIEHVIKKKKLHESTVSITKSRRDIAMVPEL